MKGILGRASWKRRGTLLALATLTAFATVACANGNSRSSSSGTKPTTFTFLTSSFASDFDPETGVTVPAGQVITNVYPSWYYYPTSLKDGVLVPNFRAPIAQWQPRLIASWKQDSPTSWTYTLRDNVKSCAGNTITTDDVIYTFSRAKALHLQQFSLYVSGGVWDTSDKSTALGSEVTAVNKTTFKIQTLKPSQLLPYIFADRTHAIIFDSALMKQHTTATDPWSKAWLQSGQSAGFGPYCVSSVDTTAQQTVLKANPTWRWPTPQFQTVTLRTVPDASSRLEAIRSGAADGTLELSAQQYASLNSAASVYSDPNAQLIYLGLNYKVAPWNLPHNDVLRKAIATALPYDAIIGGPLAGAAQQMSGIVPPVYAGSATYKPFKTDVAAAKQMLAQAGLDPAEINKNTQGLTLYYSQAHEAVVGSAANQIRTGLAQIGINIQIQTVPQAQYQSQGVVGHQFPMMLFVGNPGNYPLASASADIFFKSTGVADFTNYSNSTVDSLILQANTAASADVYNNAARQMQDQMWADLPVVPIAQLKNIIALRKGYSGFEDYTVALFPYYALIRSS